MQNAVNASWSQGPWTETLTKWLVQLKSPIVITTVAKADLFIFQLPVAIAKRDKCVLTLMVLFREPFAYGEIQSTSMLAKDMKLNSATSLFKPTACELHHQILLAAKTRANQVCA